MNRNFKIVILCIFIFCCNIIYITDTQATNVGCTYVMKKDSCDGGYEELENGSKFTATINIDNTSIPALSIDNTPVSYMNNTSTSGYINLQIGKTKYSAVSYYKQYNSCPRYFAIEQNPEVTYDGYFIHDITDNVKAYTVCVFPLEEVKYDENLDKEEELFDCTLYSSNPLYSEIGVGVHINYTQKTISFGNEPNTVEAKKALEEYKKNFDYTKKNKCPVNDLKICVLNDIAWLYTKDYDDTPVKMCSVLDSSEKLEVGDSYCGPVVNYIKEINANMETNSYMQTQIELNSFCNLILKSDDYDSYKYSCINMCLNRQNWIEYNDLKIEVKCGFSEKLIQFIANIIKWVKYIIPPIIIVLSILDFIKAIGASKEDEISKAKEKFIKRLIVAALIFITPLIIEFVLNKMGFDANGCGIIDL